MRLIDEIIGYFELCSLDTDPTRKAKRKFEQYIKYLNDLSEAMEEQEPVKPIYQGDDSYVCDNCGETVGWEEMACCGIDQVKFKYCPGCGRPVDWNG